MTTENPLLLQVLQARMKNTIATPRYVVMKRLKQWNKCSQWTVMPHGRYTARIGEWMKLKWRISKCEVKKSSLSVNCYSVYFLSIVKKIILLTRNLWHLLFSLEFLDLVSLEYTQYLRINLFIFISLEFYTCFVIGRFKDWFYKRCDICSCIILSFSIELFDEFS